MIGKKVGGMRVVRIGPFTFMFCKRKASNAQRREAALLKRAKRKERNGLVTLGRKWLRWEAEFERVEYGHGVITDAGHQWLADENAGLM